MGPRAYRVIFAAISLPLATLAVAHFINHRRAWQHAGSRPLLLLHAGLVAERSRGPRQFRPGLLVPPAACMGRAGKAGCVPAGIRPPARCGCMHAQV